MQIVVGPVVTRDGGYAFDLWTRERGLARGFCYRRVEDARYARNVEIRSRGPMVACATLDQFAAALGERHNPPAG